MDYDTARVLANTWVQVISEPNGHRWTLRPGLAGKPPADMHTQQLHHCAELAEQKGIEWLGAYRPDLVDQARSEARRLNYLYGPLTE